MLPTIEENSVIFTNKMNCFIESFEEKKINDNVKYTIYVSTRDLVTNGSARLFDDDNFGKNQYIKIFLIDDENFFNSLNDENYFQRLEETPNKYVQKKIDLYSFLGDKETIAKHELESTIDAQSIYKLFYSAEFDVKFSNFIGFVSYVFYDADELARKNNLKNVSKQILNKGYRLDKHILIRQGKINKLKQALVTQNKKLWYSTFETRSQNPYATLNGVQYPLAYENFKIKVVNDIDSSILEKLLDEPIAKKQTKKDDYLENNSCIGNIYHSFDSDGDLKIYFAFDIFSFITKNSNLYRVLNKQVIEDLSYIDNFRNLSSVSLFEVYKKRLDNGEINKSGFEIRENIDMSFINSLSDIPNETIFYEITDTEYKYYKGNKYSYFLNIGVKDGLREYFKNFIIAAEEELAQLKKYQNYCEILSYKENEQGAGIFYDYNKKRFTTRFIVSQQQPNSLWKNVEDFALVYKNLYNLTQQKQLEEETQEILLEMVDPMYASLETIQKVVNNFDNLIFNSKKMLSAQYPSEYKAEFKLIDSITPEKEKTFYSYFDGDSYSGFLKDEFFSIKPPKKIVNLVANSNTKKIDLFEENLYGALSNFKLSEDCRQVIIDDIQKKFSAENIAFNKEEEVFYELLSEYSPIFFDLQLKKPKFRTNEELKIFMTSNYDTQTLKSIYFKLNPYEQIPESESSSEIVNRIFAFLSKYAPFYLEFFSRYLIDTNISRNFYSDAQKILFFSIFYGKAVKVEFLENFEKNKEGRLLFKKEKWKMLEKNLNPIKQGTSVFARLTVLDLKELSFINDPKTDLEIINKYVVLRAE